MFVDIFLDMFGWLPSPIVSLIEGVVWVVIVILVLRLLKLLWDCLPLV